MVYLCKVHKKLYIMVHRQILKEKAAKYLVCFNENCPLHVHCLRWQVSRFVSDSRLVISCINPNLSQAVEGKCPAYRNDTPQPVARGMVHFYDDMPRKTEVEIKTKLISRYGRTGYYDMRRGTRQITAEIQEEIRQVCCSCGWTVKLRFDGYSEELVW